MLYKRKNYFEFSMNKEKTNEFSNYDNYVETQCFRKNHWIA